VSEEKPRGLRKKIVLCGLGFLLLVLLITTIFGKKGLIEIARARKTQATLLQQIETLEGEKARLEREIAALKSDPKAVDREAREKLWLMKPDEKVIIKKNK
jgi:cell division protein FtsB